MESKLNLKLYRDTQSLKNTTGYIDDNTRGGALLSMARAGMLPRRAHRKASRSTIDPISGQKTLNNVDHKL